MAKYNECAVRLDEQGHARLQITELDTFMDQLQEEKLLKNMTASCG